MVLLQDTTPGHWVKSIVRMSCSRTLQRGLHTQWRSLSKRVLSPCLGTNDSPRLFS
jgi:hypothetical protein